MPTETVRNYEFVVSYNVNGERHEATIKMAVPAVDVGDHLAAIIGEGKGDRLVIVPEANLRIASFASEEA